MIVFVFNIVVGVRFILRYRGHSLSLVLNIKLGSVPLPPKQPA